MSLMVNTSHLQPRGNDVDEFVENKGFEHSNEVFPQINNMNGLMNAFIDQQYMFRFKRRFVRVIPE